MPSLRGFGEARTVLRASGLLADDLADDLAALVDFDVPVKALLRCAALADAESDGLEVQEAFRTALFQARVGP